jgi:hypothetical protein
VAARATSTTGSVRATRIVVQYSWC